MKELIREFERASGLGVYGLGMDSNKWNAATERFSKLIVQECVRYFNEDYQRDFGILWREDLSNGIKQHFGVEE